MSELPFQPEKPFKALGQASREAERRFQSLVRLLERLDRRTDSGRPLPEDEGSNQLVQVRLGIAGSLFTALHLKHKPTAEHCLRVAVGCTTWAARYGLKDRDRDELEVAALLHDIGKIGVRDVVLRKAGPLSQEETAEIERYHQYGYEILTTCSSSRSLLDIFLYAPAWYDGSKPEYTRSGERLPLGARMLAIVDAFDAMTTDQVYRRAMSRERAVAELFEHAGTQFAPHLVENFCELISTDQVHLNAALAGRWLQELEPGESQRLWGEELLAASQPVTYGNIFHQKLIESMHDGVVYVDSDRTILLWNRAVERLTGIAAPSVLECQWEPELIAMQDEHGTRITSDNCPLASSLEHRVQVFRRMKIRDRSGASLAVDVHLLPVIGQDSKIYGAALILHNASSKISLEERVQTLHARATQDSLTKVANRAEFDQAHAEFVRTHLADGLACSLIVCDIDGFKTINDQYGHQAGDQALISFATLLKRYCRPEDFVARYGGEEFVVLCADCDNAAATRRAEEMRRELAALPQPALAGRHLTCSFGVTELQDGDTPETMFRRADRALLQAKQLGRNRVVQLGTGRDANSLKPVHKRCFARSRETPVQGVVQCKLATRVPFNIAIEKLRGFVSDHHAVVLSIEEHRVLIQLEGRHTRFRHRRADRPGPLRIELDFSELPAHEETDVGGRHKKTLIDVTIRPLRNRDRRKSSLAEQGRQLRASLMSYLMASDYVEQTPEETPEQPG